jgi:hypothetical protein
MATLAREATEQPRFLTREEALELLDEAARYYLQMSGDEFVKAWDGGKFDEDPDRPEVMSVGMLRHLAP